MKIYNDAYSKYYKHEIGHASNSAIIYSDPYSEYHQYAIGHVNDKGIIYSDPYSEYHQYAVGHVNDKGIIYSDPYSEYHQYAVAHVNDKGIIYSDPYSEYHQYAVAHVDTVNYKLAAAAYLLLIYGKNYARSDSSSSTRGEPRRPSAGEAHYGSSSPASSGGSGGAGGGGAGGGGGIFKMLVIIAVVIFILVVALKGAVLSFLQIPAALVSLAIILIVGIPNSDIGKRNIMDEIKSRATQEMKNKAKGRGALFSIVPMVLWVMYAMNNEEIFMFVFGVGACVSAMIFFLVYRVYLYRFFSGKTPIQNGENVKTNYFYATAIHNEAIPEGKVLFSCPFCEGKCVAPANAGKIKIKCENCGNYFYADTNRIEIRK